MTTMHLNEQQTRVASAPIDATLRVMAGAGSGKTRVLVERYVELLERDGVDPARILALTFTLRAAAEMKRRVHERVGERMPALLDALRGAWIMNFHQFGLRVIRENAPAFEIDPGAGVAAGAQLQAITNVLRRRFLDGDLAGMSLEFGGEIPPPARLESRFDLALKVAAACRDEMLSPQQLQERAEGAADGYRALVGDVVAVANAYQAELRSRRLLDFDDMILIPVAAMTADRSLRRRYQRQFDHILVDEFQDTSRAQNELLRLLSTDEETGEEYARVTVVGDEKQAIYRFRNAKVENIQTFPGQKVGLGRNYRSTQPILDLAQAFVDRIERLEPIRLEAARRNEAAPVVVFHPRGEGRSSEDEAAALVGWIHHLTTGEVLEGLPDLLSGREPLRAQDITILMRGLTAGYGLDRVENALGAAGVPYAIVGGAMGGQKWALEAWHALLSLLLPGDRSRELLTVLERPPLSVPDDRLVALLSSRERARDVDEVLSEAVIAALDEREDGERGPRAGGDARQLDLLAGNNLGVADRVRALAAFVAQMRRRWRSDRFGDFIHWTLEAGPFQLHLLERGVATESVDDLAHQMVRLAHESEVRGAQDLAEFLTHVRDIIDGHGAVWEPELRLPGECVRVMSIHQAKGLEFKAVGLVGVKSPPNPRDGFFISGRDGLLLGSSWPTTWGRSYTDNAEREEERAMSDLEESCLLYVGMTRAQDYLFVSSPFAEGVERAGKDPWQFGHVIAAARAVTGAVEWREVPTVTRAGPERRRAQDGAALDESLAARNRSREVVAAHAPATAAPRLPIAMATWSDLWRFRGQEAGAVTPEAGTGDGAGAGYGGPPDDAAAVAIPGGLAPADYGTFVHEVLRTTLASSGRAREVLRAQATRFGFTGRRRESVVVAVESLLEGVRKHRLLQAGDDLRVEEPFQVRLENVVFGGVIDRVERDGARWRVIDYKIGTAEESHVFQVQYYVWAVRRITGEDATGQVCYLRDDGVHVVGVPPDSAEIIEALAQRYDAEGSHSPTS